jgi:nucleotide-binding universal stress UspA family protein
VKGTPFALFYSCWEAWGTPSSLTSFNFLLIICATTSSVADSSYTSLTALEDFRRARLKASLQDVVARLTGSSTELLSYDEVRKQLRAVESPVHQLREIPLNAIVGSVGRYNDFTRDFLPRTDSDKQRWTKVKELMLSQSGVPPIEVYQLGDAYFVKDGNHRVSVAKEMALSHIEAYVTPVHSTVDLSPETTADELIVKAEYANFLTTTQLHDLRPNANLSVTVPGQYDILLDHITVHQYFMGLDLKRDVSYEEAVAHWYDNVYVPVVAMLRERGLLQAFPNRTMTDLYVYLAKHRAELEQALGWNWQLRPEAVVDNLVRTLGVNRAEQRRLTLEDSPVVAQSLFDDILVTVSGSEDGWDALEQALILADREKANLYGLHVITDSTTLQVEAMTELKATFDERCQAFGLTGQLAVEIGSVVATLGERSTWADVVIATLSYPPTTTSSLFNTGFHALLRRVPKPVLAVPHRVTSLQKPLLGYDGTAKADLALYIATYLALKWQVPLSVVTVKQRGRTTKKTLERAQTYLRKHGVNAQYFLEEGNVTEILMSKLAETESDLLILGSYEYSSLLEPVLGGTLDDILRHGTIPMLICQ